MSAPTLDAILRDADLSVVRGSGYLTLRIEVSRNLFGGQPLLHLYAADPTAPRRKPVNLLRMGGAGADVLVGDPGSSAADLLAIVAEALRTAQGAEALRISQRAEARRAGSRYNVAAAERGENPWEG